MTSERKISANRANAKASTGPSTARGKSKAAQNARRHGLSISTSADPVRAAEVKNLAREIAGRKANAETLDVAHGIAEASIDLVRIRKARHELFSTKRPFEKMASPKIEPIQAKQFAIELLDLTKRLELISRYERRALSRRKFDIRELDALRRQIA